MKILVTGAAGFIGSHLVEALIHAGHTVRAMDLAFTGEEQPGAERLERIAGDITVEADCRAAAQKCDAVCHLAAKVADWGPSEVFFKVNVEGTRNLIKAAKSAGVKRFVLISSLSVHHYRGYPMGDESTPRDSRMNAYARSKIAAEDVAWEHAGPIEVAVVRPGVFPFGPRDRTSFAPLARALERGRLGFVNGGRAVVGTAYVENLVEGMRLVVEHPRAAGETFVIGDDRQVTWRELFGLFTRELGVPPPKLSIPLPVVYSLASIWELVYGLLGVKRAPMLTRYRILLAGRDCYFSSEKARRLLGYQPRVGLEDAVRRTVAWYRSAEEPS